MISNNENQVDAVPHKDQLNPQLLAIDLLDQNLIPLQHETNVMANMGQIMHDMIFSYRLKVLHFTVL